MLSETVLWYLWYPNFKLLLCTRMFHFPAIPFPSKGVCWHQLGCFCWINSVAVDSTLMVFCLFFSDLSRLPNTMPDIRMRPMYLLDTNVLPQSSRLPETRTKKRNVIIIIKNNTIQFWKVDSVGIICWNLAWSTAVYSDSLLNPTNTFKRTKSNIYHLSLSTLLLCGIFSTEIPHQTLPEI